VGELVDNSAFDLFKYGWIAIPFAVLWLYPFVVSSLLAAVALAGLGRKLAAIIVALLVFGTLMPGSLGLAAWLANPVIAIAWLFYLANHRRTSLILATIALVLTLSFLFVGEVPFGLKNGDVPIVSHGAGFWLWVASPAVLAVGICVEDGYLGKPLLTLRRLAVGSRL
jgi:hypothetical protein